VDNFFKFGLSETWRCFDSCYQWPKNTYPSFANAHWGCSVVSPWRVNAVG